MFDTDYRIETEGPHPRPELRQRAASKACGETMAAQTAQRDSVDAAHDVVEFLIGQHMQIRDLFTEVEMSTGKARRDAFERLVMLLAVHETAEEQLLHPMVRTGVHGGDDIVEEREAKEKLEDVGPDAAEFSSLLARAAIQCADACTR